MGKFVESKRQVKRSERIVSPASGRRRIRQFHRWPDHRINARATDEIAVILSL
jgi:hypothetical protein